MLKNNLFGQILIGLLVVFLLIGSVQMLGLGQSIAKVEIAAEEQISLPAIPKDINTNKAVKSTDNMALVNNITTRPMFSSDRAPFVALEDNSETNPEENPEPIAELKAKLTGIVITPEQSYAMILDNLTNQRESYKIGMPLAGEQGGWTLTEIHSRKVVFTSDDEKSEELELAIHGGTAAPKARNPAKAKTRKRAKSSAGKEKESSTTKDKKRNADDIRKKIAERRAQMRAEAAKNK